jgi:hypothetical protein
MHSYLAFEVNLHFLSLFQLIFSFEFDHKMKLVLAISFMHILLILCILKEVPAFMIDRPCFSPRFGHLVYEKYDLSSWETMLSAFIAPNDLIAA